MTKTILMTIAVTCIFFMAFKLLQITLLSFTKTSRNDNETTPKGYKSFALYKWPTKKGETQVNLLKKKDFLDKYGNLLAFIIFLILVIYKVHVGDFQF